MTKPNHITRIANKADGPRNKWRGICSCGHKTPWVKDYTQACRDCFAHKDDPNAGQQRLDIA